MVPHLRENGAVRNGASPTRMVASQPEVGYKHQSVANRPGDALGRKLAR